MFRNISPEARIRNYFTEVFVSHLHLAIQLCRIIHTTPCQGGIFQPQFLQSLYNHTGEHMRLTYLKRADQQDAN